MSTRQAPGIHPPHTLLPSPEQTRPHQWPAHTLLELGALPEAVPCARTHARVMLTIWNLPEMTDSVELLVAELMSNGVKAARQLNNPVCPPVRMRLSCDGQRLLVEVWDASPKPPVLADAEFLADNGRGLHLVEAVSDKWGYYPTEDGGKVVWGFVVITD